MPPNNGGCRVTKLYRGAPFRQRFPIPWWPKKPPSLSHNSLFLSNTFNWTHRPDSTDSFELPICSIICDSNSYSRVVSFAWNESKCMGFVLRAAVVRDVHIDWPVGILECWAMWFDRFLKLRPIFWRVRTMSMVLNNDFRWLTVHCGRLCRALDTLFVFMWLCYRHVLRTATPQIPWIGVTCFQFLLSKVYLFTRYLRGF